MHDCGDNEEIIQVNFTDMEMYLLSILFAKAVQMMREDLDDERTALILGAVCANMSDFMDERYAELGVISETIRSRTKGSSQAD